MRLLNAIAADGAQTLPDGKFNIFGGGIEILAAPDFPAMAPSFAILVRLAVESDELDRPHVLRVELHNPTGQNVFPVSAATGFTTQRSADAVVDDPDFPVTHLFVLNFPNLLFAQDGKHLFRFFVDDIEVGRLPMYLVKRQVSGHTNGSQED